jgi:hypothetical protein
MEMARRNDMASPRKLVRVVADMLGAPEATVIQHDRNLVAAGLRSKGGRGLSAAQVTSRDAANLLIAICGSSPFGASVKETVTTYRRYATLRAFKDCKLGLSRVKSQLPTLGSLPDEHTFLDALAALIDSIAAGEFKYQGRETGDISVFLHDLGPTASINIKIQKSIRLPYRRTPDHPDIKADLRQDRSFSIITLRELARVVAAASPGELTPTPPEQRPTKTGSRTLP